jgi:anti-sigma B factor antagonist
MTAPIFSISMSAPSADECIVTVVGELDLGTAAQLRDALDVAPPDVVVDMSGVTFADSTALHVLVSAHELRDGDGHRLLIRHPGDAVVRLFEVTGLADVFNVEKARSDSSS